MLLLKWELVVKLLVFEVVHFLPFIDESCIIRGHLPCFTN